MRSGRSVSPSRSLRSRLSSSPSRSSPCSRCAAGCGARAASDAAAGASPLDAGAPPACLAWMASMSWPLRSLPRPVMPSSPASACSSGSTIAASPPLVARRRTRGACVWAGACSVVSAVGCGEPSLCASRSVVSVKESPPGEPPCRAGRRGGRCCRRQLLPVRRGPHRSPVRSEWAWCPAAPPSYGGARQRSAALARATHGHHDSAAVGGGAGAVRPEKVVGTPAASTRPVLGIRCQDSVSAGVHSYNTGHTRRGATAVGGAGCAS